MVNNTNMKMVSELAVTVAVLLLGLVSGQCFFTSRCSTLYDKGMSYRGPVNYTSNGRACVSWQHHVHDVTPERYPYDGLDENYCRNPRGHQGAPWCYTSPENDGSKIWDYCPVRNCDPCLFRGVQLKEGDRFHHGCTLCFCQKTGIRCLECPQTDMTDKVGCYMKTDWSASFPVCCPHEVCYGNKAFKFDEFVAYLKTALPQRAHAELTSHQTLPTPATNRTVHQPFIIQN